MSEKKSKNIVIIALCITLIFMGVGFAALSETLTINGTATVTGTWDIKITGIEAVKGVYAHTAIEPENLSYFSVEDGTKSTSAYGDQEAIHGVVGGLDTTAATFDVDLNEPGDYVIYKVTITNNGTIAAKLNTSDGITLTDNSPEITNNGTVAVAPETGTKLFLYSMGSYSAGTYNESNDLGSLASGMGSLLAGENDYYYVKVEYNQTKLTTAPSTNNTATGTVTFSYVQNS